MRMCLYLCNYCNFQTGSMQKCKPVLAMIDSSRLFYCVLLCLFCMSEDVNDDINETLRDNIGTVLHEYRENDRKIVQSLENLTKKHTNARYAVIFTETCINENLLPKFTNIYIYIYHGYHNGYHNGYIIVHI